MRIGRARDGLAIGNLWRVQDDIDAVFLLELRDDDLHMQLSLAADEYFVCSLIASEVDCRILLDDSRQGGVDFVFVAARFRLDGEGDRWFRVLNVFEHDGMILR